MQILGTASRFAWENAPHPSAGNNAGRRAVISATASAQLPQVSYGSDVPAARETGSQEASLQGHFNKDQVAGSNLYHSLSAGAPVPSPLKWVIPSEVQRGDVSATLHKDRV